MCSVELLEMGNFELKRHVFQRFLCSLLEEGGNFSPDTWAAGVAPSLLSSTGSVVINAMWSHLLARHRTHPVVQLRDLLLLFFAEWELVSCKGSRFAGVGRIGRRCQALTEKRRKEERVGEALAVRLRGTRHGGQAVEE